jgi:hypothetical protein
MVVACALLVELVKPKRFFGSAYEKKQTTHAKKRKICFVIKTFFNFSKDEKNCLKDLFVFYALQFFLKELTLQR